MDLTSITPDAAGLRALAHPARLRILGHLRSDGPATATSLAARMGLNSGATSYHLRTLAKHGFVVDDADRGNGRERWWRAAHQSTQFSEVEREPEGGEALDGFLQAVAVVHTERLQRYVEERSSLPEAWAEASGIADWNLRLTPARALQLRDAIQAVVWGWDEDADEAVDDSGAAELYEVILHAFPVPGRLGRRAGAEDA